MSDINEIIGNLIKLLDTKLTCFSELFDITKDQTLDIDNNEGENLSVLVDKKQVVINKVDSIDEAFKVQFEALKKTLNVKSLDEIAPEKYPRLKEVKDRVDKLISVTKEIMDIEKANSNKVNVIFENVKNELKEIKRGKVSIRAYERPSINVDGIYLDKKK